MRHVRIAILGGGITGQLVHYQLPDSEVFDWHKDGRAAYLTRSYGANYLWKPLDGFPCRHFRVITHVDGTPATLESVHAYKTKIGKLNDVAGWERQFRPEMDGYDFLSLPMPRCIHYDHRVTEIHAADQVMKFAPSHNGEGREPLRYDVLISTIPLYSLLSLMGRREPEGRLRFKPIYFKVSPRPPDAPFPREVMYVNYISSMTVPIYRYCDRFGERHYESIVSFNGAGLRRLSPGKIYPHPAVPDVLADLAEHNIFTFGRYASWHPDELVHETWEAITEWKENVYEP